MRRQALDFLTAVLSYESKPGVFALRRQPLSRCDITFLVLLVCFLESDYRSRGFPNETFVSVNRYFTQPLKSRILKPVFVWPANILSQSLQLNKWGRFKWLLEKPMMGLSAGTSGSGVIYLLSESDFNHTSREPTSAFWIALCLLAIKMESRVCACL